MLPHFPPKLKKDPCENYVAAEFQKESAHNNIMLQFLPNYLKKNPPQNYVQKSGKLAQGHCTD